RVLDPAGRDIAGQHRLAGGHRHLDVSHLQAAAAEALAQVVVDVFVRAHVALGVHRGTRLALVREAQARAAREITLAGALAAPLRIVGPAVAARIALARFAARVCAAGRGVVAAAIGYVGWGIWILLRRFGGS